MAVDLPPITQQPIICVDATPDADYVLRILRAYRENCNCRCEGMGALHTCELCEVMNQAQEERARLLDFAIDVLQSAKKDGIT